MSVKSTRVNREIIFQGSFYSSWLSLPPAYCALGPAPPSATVITLPCMCIHRVYVCGGRGVGVMQGVCGEGV